MLHPRLPIRRFDVFAEYNRQEALAKGVPEDEAAGYGLWVAKVVASGGGRGRSPFSPSAPRGNGHAAPAEGAAPAPDEKWHSLGGEPQTAALFEHEIVARMGREFYETVFAPAIAEALQQHKSYQAIRDTIRRDWKPAPPGTR